MPRPRAGPLPGSARATLNLGKHLHLRIAGRPDLRKEIGVAAKVECQAADARLCIRHDLPYGDQRRALAVHALNRHQVRPHGGPNLVVAGGKNRASHVERERNVRLQNGPTLRKRPGGRKRRQANEHRENSVFHNESPHPGYGVSAEASLTPLDLWLPATWTIASPPWMGF